jgi:hypothetical protein
MTPDERQMLAGLFDRVRAAAHEPRDRDAEAFIADRLRAQPEAPYVLAQAVLLQEQAIAAQAQKIEDLEARLRDAEQRAAQAAVPAAPSGGGFLAGRSALGAAPPAPSGNWGRAPVAGGADRGIAPPVGMGMAPQGAPGPWAGAAPQQPSRGGGFLTGALGAVAGVAGGMMIANALGGLFGGGQSGQTAQAPQGADKLPAADQSQQGGFEPSGAQYQDAGWSDDSGGDFGGGGDDSFDA